MSGYTITITSDKDENNTTTLHLEVTAGAVRITDVHVHAGKGLPDGHLPAIDFALLVEAVAGGAVKAAATTAFEPARVNPPAPAARTARTRPAKVGKATEATKKAGPAARTATAKTTKTAPTSARATSPAKAAPNAKAAQPAESNGASVSRAAGVATGRTRRGDRAYRRTPEDFVEVFRRVGGATAAAKHYGVPRHTANGWVRRLREQGALSW